MKKIQKHLILAFTVLTGVVLTGSAQAQVLWTTPSLITGVGDIATNGSYLDAIKASTVEATIDQTIGTTTFNIINSGGTEVDGPGDITLSNFLTTAGNDGSFTSAPPSSAAYANILRGVTGVQIGDPAGTVTLNGLTSGSEYQVQVWNATASSENDIAELSGASPVELNGSDFVLGTFTATGSSQSFDFSVPADNVTPYAAISAVAVRDLTETPEPVTWALMLGSMAFLVLLVPRNLLKA